MLLVVAHGTKKRTDNSNLSLLFLRVITASIDLFPGRDRV
jgi:hypothetical protein